MGPWCQPPEQLPDQWFHRLTQLQKRTIHFKVDKEIAEGNPTDGSSLTLNELGTKWNDQEIIEKILAYSKEERVYKRVLDRLKARFNDPFQLTPQWKEQEVQTALQKAMPTLFAQQPINAKRVFNEKDEILYEAEQAAWQPDITTLMERLSTLDAELLWKGEPVTIDLPLKKVEAAITMQDLKEEGKWSQNLRIYHLLFVRLIRSRS